VSVVSRKLSGQAGLGLLALASMLLLVLSIGAGVSIGELSIPFDTALRAITNGLGWTDFPLDNIYESVIWNYRLSRALVACLCGAGLALCGAILQSLLRNPLAEPYVLGISAGAFAGSLAAFLFVVILASGARGGADRTILAGVAASQLFNALTSYIVSTSADAQQARDVMFWLLGSFGGVRWPEFQLALVVMLIGFAICLYYARALDAFTFGDDAASSLGIPVGRVRVILFATTAMMTATIVSMVGSIGFVGLVVPHAARFLVGPLHLRLLPACVAIGAIFMVLADIVSRVIIPQQVLPIGVVTALIGVPFFSVILYRARRAA
tara:strand:+ start:134 stop:1105 length:972 start_codon:yes stop_codon:yes gene_type:complete